MADSDTYDVLRMADQSNQNEKMHYITKEKNNI